MDYRQLAQQIAQEQGVDPGLFARVIQQESGFNPNARSPVGAMGLGQVMPATAADPGFGITPLPADQIKDPEANLRFSAQYLNAMLDRFGGDQPKALAAYNAGAGNVERYGGIPPFEETQNYVRSILGGEAPAARPTRGNNMAEVQRGGGLFGGLFGGGQQEPQDGNETSTDPFENLSRSQRTMLGFAALRDAAASLEGRDSQYFQGALGGFEQGRERERLRQQGIQQNQVGALQALAQVEQQIALSQAYGVAPSPAALQMRDMLMQSVGGGGGMAAPTQVQSPMPAQAPVTGVAPPAPVTTSPIPPQGGGFDPTQVQISGEPAPAAAPAAAPVDPMQALDAREAELLQRANAITAAGGDTGPIQMELRQLEGQRERIAAEAEAGQEAQTAQLESEAEARRASYNSQIIDDIINDPNLEGIVGRIEGRADPRGAGGALLFDEDEMNVLSKLEQLQGTVFLEAFESLKGGGQITQIEGEKAERAQARITNRAVSPEAFRQSLRELQQIMKNAEARALGQPVPFPEIATTAPDEPTEPTAATLMELAPEDMDLVQRYLQ